MSSEIFNSCAQNQADWVLKSRVCELHQSWAALISRPTFWAFHNVVSETQGVYTLGTSPWNDSVKKARKAAATAPDKETVQTYLLFIDLESPTSINESMQNIKDGESDIDPNSYFQRFSLNTNSRTSGSASPVVNSD
jgi:hypothetical protein